MSSATRCWLSWSASSPPAGEVGAKKGAKTGLGRGTDPSQKSKKFNRTHHVSGLTDLVQFCSGRQLVEAITQITVAIELALEQGQNLVGNSVQLLRVRPEVAGNQSYQSPENRLDLSSCGLICVRKNVRLPPARAFRKCGNRLSRFKHARSMTESDDAS